MSLLEGMFSEELNVPKEIAANLKGHNETVINANITAENTTTGDVKSLKEAATLLPTPAKQPQDTLTTQKDLPEEELDPEKLEMLNEFIDEFPGQVEKKEPFVVDSDEKYHWTIKRQHELLEKMEEIKRIAQTHIDHHERKAEMVKTWQKKTIASLQWFFKHLEAKVFQFLWNLNEEGQLNKKRSISSPYGVSGFRKQKPSFEIENEDELREFLEAYHPEKLEPVKPKILWGELTKEMDIRDNKAVIAKTGQEVKGVKGSKNPDKFYQKIAS